MATLERIRKHGVALICIVGAALLIFIISDFISSSSSYFAEAKANVAIINGKKIKFQNYQERINQLNTVVKLEYGGAVNDETSEQIRSMVWESLVAEETIGEECKRIGLTVTKDELSDMLMGNNISAMLRSNRMFADENGVFNVDALKNFLAFINSDEIPAQMSPDQYNDYRTWWQYWESSVKFDRLNQKYTTLITKGMVVNKLEAQNSYEAAHVQADVVYAMRNYFAIADSTITVSESAVKELYNKRKPQLKQAQSTDIAYIAVPISPSKEDYEAVEKFIDETKEEFATTSDIVSFMNINSETQYRAENLSKEQVDADFAEFAFSAKVDSTTAPQLYGDVYKMARLIEKGISRPDSVNLSHMFINSQELADSIVKAVEAGANFADLAREHSLGNVGQNGGEIGWVTEEGLEAKFAEPAFTTAKGKLFQVKEGDIINLFIVNDVTKNVDKVKIAVYSRSVTASSRTRTSIYNSLKQYVVANNKVETFTANASEAGYTAKTAQTVNINATSLNDIRKAREVVRWAFENKVGAVSDVFEIEGYIVAAAVSEKYKEGTRSLESVREQLVAELRRDVKAEQLIAEMQGKSIEDLAAAEGYLIDTARNITFATNYAGSIGSEPVLFARAQTANINVESAPMKGNSGVFIFKVINKHDNEREYNEKEEVAMLTARQSYQAQYQITESLRTAAKIEDLRYKYY